MELSWRTALILLGLAAVVWVVFDGIKRMRRARAEALRLDVDPGFVSARDDFENPELPSGGWRAVRPKGETEPSLNTPLVFADDQLPSGLNANDEVLEEFEPSFDISEQVAEFEEEPVAAEPVAEIEEVSAAVAEITEPQPQAVPTRPVNLDEQVPVLLDVEELGATDMADAPSFTANVVAGPEVAAAEEVMATHTTASAETETPAEPVFKEFEQPAEETPAAAEAEAEVTDIKTAISPVNYAHPDAEKLHDRPAADITLVIHCIARKGQEFAGKDVLYFFNSCDLRFGEGNMFHRFEAAEGKGCVQFSVVHSFAPQTFTPELMATQNFGGFSFFMRLPGPKMSLQAYEVMLGMAKMLEEHFDAELFDGDRSALTQQTIEHNRQQITEYERRQHLAEKKRMRG